LDATYMVFRAELRRRWRSWLVLALLVGVVGGIVLGAAAAGRRTASAFPWYVSTYGYDYTVFNLAPVPGLAKLPGVASVVSAAAPASASLGAPRTKLPRDGRVLRQAQLAQEAGEVEVQPERRDPLVPDLHGIGPRRVIQLPVRSSPKGATRPSWIPVSMNSDA
jgi:hypothetical protein